MLTAGIAILFGLGIGGLAFLWISKRRGAGFAYLALCWVPLVILGAAYGARNQLGYLAVVPLMTVMVASLGLVALGVGLSVRARRMRSQDANRLVMGTVVAGLPALIVIAALYWPKAN